MAIYHHHHNIPQPFIFSFLLFPIQFPTTLSQSLRSLFRRNITLWLRHHFISDEEFSHGRASEERRIEVNVEM